MSWPRADMRQRAAHGDALLGPPVVRVPSATGGGRWNPEAVDPVGLDWPTRDVFVEATPEGLFVGVTDQPVHCMSDDLLPVCESYSRTEYVRCTPVLADVTCDECMEAASYVFAEITLVVRLPFAATRHAVDRTQVPAAGDAAANAAAAFLRGAAVEVKDR